jgi:hypothetical protein
MRTWSSNSRSYFSKESERTGGTRDAEHADRHGSRAIGGARGRERAARRAVLRSSDGRTTVTHCRASLPRGALLRALALCFAAACSLGREAPEPAGAASVAEQSAALAKAAPAAVQRQLIRSRSSAS